MLNSSARYFYSSQCIKTNFGLPVQYCIVHQSVKSETNRIVFDKVMNF